MTDTDDRPEKIYKLSEPKTYIIVNYHNGHDVMTITH